MKTRVQQAAALAKQKQLAEQKTDAEILQALELKASELQRSGFGQSPEIKKVTETHLNDLIARTWLQNIEKLNGGMARAFIQTAGFSTPQTEMSYGAAGAHADSGSSGSAGSDSSVASSDIGSLFASDTDSHASDGKAAEEHAWSTSTSISALIPHPLTPAEEERFKNALAELAAQQRLSQNDGDIEMTPAAPIVQSNNQRTPLQSESLFSQSAQKAAKDAEKEKALDLLVGSSWGFY